MEKRKMEDLLIVMLDCGSRDLELLNKCEYDLGELYEEVKEQGLENITINTLVAVMFDKAKGDVQENIEERKHEISEEITETESDIENIQNEIDDLQEAFSEAKTDARATNDLYEKESSMEDRLTDLQDKVEYLKEAFEINDIHEDVESFHNFIDTHVFFVNGKGKYYTDFYADEINKFEYLTGFAIDE